MHINRSHIKKKYFVLFLLFLFMLPILVKATHHLYISHEHISHTEETSECKVDKIHEKCPICEYQITELIKEKYKTEFHKGDFVSEKCYYKPEIIKISLHYTFPSRASPVDF